MLPLNDSYRANILTRLPIAVRIECLKEYSATATRRAKPSISQYHALPSRLSNELFMRGVSGAEQKIVLDDKK